MNNNKRNKRKSPKTRSQLPSSPPNSASSQLERLRLLVEKRFNRERVNRGELINRLSAKFQSFDEFIEHNMLLMLVLEKACIEARDQGRRIKLIEIQETIDYKWLEHVVASKLYPESLLTDTVLIETLLADEQLIDMVIEYILDPISLDSRLIDSSREEVIRGDE